MKHAAIAVASLALTSTVAAQGIDQLWRNNCSSCHGVRGEGGGAGTSSLLDDEYLTDGTDRDLFNSIKTGHAEQGMEAFGETLNDPEMWALVVYIREQQAREKRSREGSPRPQQGVYTSQHHKFRIETVVQEGLRVPWSVDFMPDGSLLITNRSGELVIYKDGWLSRPVQGTPEVRNRGQGGLMEVKLHPKYAENGWVYLSYSDPIGDGRRSIGMTRIVRGKLSDARWIEEQTVFRAKEEHYLPTDLHFGCKIAFDPRDPGVLFFTIGERGMGQHAQDLSRPNGKVHRIRDDGAVPQDNPFAGQANVYESIWTYGNRNPQGLSFDLQGNLWITEHGPRGGDELNLIQKGGNYGWPLVSFGINYNGAPLRTPWPDVEGLSEEIMMPTDIWLPSIGASGLCVVDGEAFPQWKGDLLAGGLSGANVDRLRVQNGKVVEREQIVHGLGRVRDVQTAPDGTIYIVLNGPDKIVRLVREE